MAAGFMGSRGGWPFVVFVVVFLRPSRLEFAESLFMEFASKVGGEIAGTLRCCMSRFGGLFGGTGGSGQPRIGCLDEGVLIT